jgi:hypothetical protein
MAKGSNATRKGDTGRFTGVSTPADVKAYKEASRSFAKTLSDKSAAHDFIRRLERGAGIIRDKKK